MKPDPSTGQQRCALVPHCTLSGVDQLAVDGGGDDGGAQVLQVNPESVGQGTRIILVQVR